MASPGTYRVRLTVGDETRTQDFEVRKDPRIPASQEDLDAQFDFLMKIRNKLSDTQDAINSIRSIKEQVQGWKQRVSNGSDSGSSDAVLNAAISLEENLTVIEEELIQPKSSVPLDRVNFPTRLNLKIASLTSVVASADAVPTQQSYEVFDELSARIDEQVERLKEVTSTDVTAFNRLIQDLGLPAVVPKA